MSPGADALLDEGGAYTATGSFADPDLPDAWTATVDYGDGAGAQPLSLRPDKTFDLGHVYADNGVYDVVATVTDSAGLAGSGTAHFVVRNVAPVVTLDAPAPGVVGAGFTLAGSFADPGADTWAATVNYGDGTGTFPLALGAGGDFTLGHTYEAGGDFSVTVSVVDDDSGIGVATRTVVVEKLHASLAAATAQCTYGGTSTLSAVLTVAGAPLAGKTVTFTLGGAAVGSAVTDAGGSAELAGVSRAAFDAGEVAVTASFAGDASHAAASAAATLKVARAPLVVDSQGASGSAATAGDVIVYDAGAGKVTGGGWFESPPGASSDPGYGGRANLGFNAQYKAGASVPTGQFEFRVGRLNFHSASFQSLLVQGPRARLAGTGAVNGRSGYSFLLTFVDGRRAGGADRIRVRIWNSISGTVIYDSGAGREGDNSLSQLLGGNTRIER